LIPAPGRGWAALAAALCALSVAAWTVDPRWLDWQPQLASTQPWRAWTAALVHWSPLHLGANLAGAALVGALGVVAPASWRMVAAWVAAWPLTQFGLVLRPEVAHFGGLSGVLHAGVAVVAVQLLVSARGRRRAIGAAIVAALTVKVLSEQPWGPALRHPDGWDIAVAPLAHASGLVVGALCALLAARLPQYPHD
jgi:rhomboid family GlyGly-CTERM serine protease